MVAITAVFLFTARNVNFNMGNSSHNKHPNEEVNRIEWEHDHMKDLTVVKDKEGKHYLEAKFTLRNANDYERWANELQKNTNDHNSEVIFDPISHSYTQSGMCGSGGVAKVILWIMAGGVRIFPFYAGGVNFQPQEQVPWAFPWKRALVSSSLPLRNW